MNAKLRRIFSAIAIGLTAMLCVVGNAVPASAAPVSLTSSETKGEGKTEAGKGGVELAAADRQTKWVAPIIQLGKECLKYWARCTAAVIGAGQAVGSVLEGAGNFVAGVGQGIGSVIQSLNNGSSRPSPSPSPTSSRSPR